MAVRHACRLRRNFGRRMVVLSDSNVGLLALSKGRSRTRQLNAQCRHMAAYETATEMQVRVRFVATEHNVADDASRRWSPQKSKACQNSAPSLPAARTTLCLDELVPMPSGTDGPPAHQIVTSSPDQPRQVNSSLRTGRGKPTTGRAAEASETSPKRTSPAQPSGEPATRIKRTPSDFTAQTYRMPVPKQALLDMQRRSLRGSGVLEIFSGCGNFSAAMRRAGIRVASEFDILNGNQFDLLIPGVVRVIEDAIKKGWVSYLHLGTPCTIWSTARHNVTNMVKAKNKEICGITLALVSIALIQLAHQHNIPWSIENPRSSKLWNFPPMAECLGRLKCFDVIFDLCRYGCPYKKTTRITTSTPQLAARGKRCTCGTNHVWLRSGDATQKAGAYPTKLCNLWASLLSENLPSD